MPVADEFHARFAATRAPLQLPAARAARAPGPRWRAASAGTIARSTSTRCSARPTALDRRARLLVVPRGRVPGEDRRSRRCTSRACAPRRPRPLRLLRQRVPASHDPQPRRRAGLRRGRQARRRRGCGELLAARDRTRGAADVRARRPLLHRRRLRRALRPAADAARRRARVPDAQRASRSAASRASRTALAAARAGADAIGLVFWTRHAARRRGRRRRARSRDALPPFVSDGRPVRRSRRADEVRRGRSTRCRSTCCSSTATSRRRSAARSAGPTSRRSHVDGRRSIC